MNKRVLIPGTWGHSLAESMSVAMDAELVRPQIVVFADGEREVQVAVDLQGTEAVLVQTGKAPVEQGIMELLLLADACKRRGASRLVAVVPYLPFSRQDREVRPGVAVGAQVLARGLQSAGIERVITIDVHSERVAGGYEVALDSIPGYAVLAGAVAQSLQAEPLCVVATDAGGVVRAKAMADEIGRIRGVAPTLAMVNKVRTATNVEATLTGDVAGRHCLLVDDILDSGGTLVAAADALRREGALAVSAAITHGLFNGNAVERVMGLGLGHLWLSDSLPQQDEVYELRGLSVVPVATAVVEALNNL